MRRTGLKGKTLHDLIQFTDSCWIWKGSVHKNSGNPLFRGWEYPRRAIWELWAPEHVKKYWGSNFRFRGTVCNNKLCVRPLHQKLQRFK